MSFFDDKEEVMNIELTQYGKKLLSRGNFKPEYYSFHDDDILYDIKFAGGEETQNETQERILNKTPICKPNYNFSDVANNLFNRDIDTKIRKAMPFSLGNSAYNSSYYPSYNLILKKGTIKTIFPDENNSYETTGSISKIPQINLNFSNLDVYASKPPLNKGCKIKGKIGDYDITTDDDVYETFRLFESNVEYLSENFDLEVFIEEKDESYQGQNQGQDRYRWRKLLFVKKDEIIKNNVLLDKKDLKENPLNNIILSERYVEHYVSIASDEAAEDINTKKYLSSCVDRRPGRFTEGGDIDIPTGDEDQGSGVTPEAGLEDPPATGGGNKIHYCD